MASKRSYFNRTLLRKNLLRFWPVWAGLLLIELLLLPFMMNSRFVSVRSGMHTQLITPELAASFTLERYWLVLGAAVVMGLVVAVLVHKYLFQARSAQFFHALPIRREGLLLTNTVSGLLILWLPTLVTAVVTLLVEAAWGVAEPVSLLQLLALYLLSTLLFFSIGTLCCYCTGMVPAAVGLYAAVNGAAALTWFVVSQLLSRFVMGYSTNSDMGLVYLLTPIAQFVDRVRVTYEPVSATEAMARLSGLDIVGLYALAGVALLGVTALLARIRQSERAGDLLAFPVLRPIFKVCAAVLGGGLAALITLSLYNLDGFWPTLLLLLAWSLVAWLVAEMLVRKSIRVFQKPVLAHWAIVALCLALGLGIMKTDLFGYARRMPDASEVRSVVFDGPGVGSGQMEDPTAVLALHKAVVDNLDQLRSDSDGVSVEFRYQLKNGRTLTRRFEIGEPQQEPPAIRQALLTFYADPQVTMASFFDGGLTSSAELDGLSIYFADDKDHTDAADLTRSQMWALYQAVEEDILAGRRTLADDLSPWWTGEPYRDRTIVVEFRFRSTQVTDDARYNPIRYSSVSITDDMTATLSCLRMFGVMK